MDAASTVIGTPFSMSPEMCSGMPYNESADVWALGCLLYELLSLGHPFNAGNILGLAHAIVHSEPAALPPERVSARSIALCAKLLSKLPADRGTAADILDEPLCREAMEALEREKEGERIAADEEAAAAAAAAVESSERYPSAGSGSVAAAADALDASVGDALAAATISLTSVHISTTSAAAQSPLLTSSMGAMVNVHSTATVGAVAAVESPPAVLSSLQRHSPLEESGEQPLSAADLVHEHTRSATAVAAAAAAAAAVPKSSRSLNSVFVSGGGDFSSSRRGTAARQLPPLPVASLALPLPPLPSMSTANGSLLLARGIAGGGGKAAAAGPSLSDLLLKKEGAAHGVGSRGMFNGGSASSGGAAAGVAAAGHAGASASTDFSRASQPTPSQARWGSAAVKPPKASLAAMGGGAQAPPATQLREVLHHASAAAPHDAAAVVTGGRSFLPGSITPTPKSREFRVGGHFHAGAGASDEGAHLGIGTGRRPASSPSSLQHLTAPLAAAGVGGGLSEFLEWRGGGGGREIDSSSSGGAGGGSRSGVGAFAGVSGIPAPHSKLPLLSTASNGYHVGSASGGGSSAAPPASSSRRSVLAAAGGGVVTVHRKLFASSPAHDAYGVGGASSGSAPLESGSSASPPTFSSGSAPAPPSFIGAGFSAPAVSGGALLFPAHATSASAAAGSSDSGSSLGVSNAAAFRAPASSDHRSAHGNDAFISGASGGFGGDGGDEHAMRRPWTVGVSSGPALQTAFSFAPPASLLPLPRFGRRAGGAHEERQPPR